MSEIILSAKTREIKQGTDDLRNQGLIPAVLYGPKTENLNLTVSETDFSAFLKSGQRTKPFSLKLDGGKEIKNILLQDFVRDSLKSRILSIDFYQFDALKKVKVSLPIVLIGKAPAVELGGVIVQSMDEIEVECLPANIPEKLVVDISVLEDFDSTVYVKDLNLPKDVSCHIDPQTAVVSVSEPAKEEEVQKPLPDVQTPEAGTAETPTKPAQ
ncbi:MAG: 50S ribosomal protein L25 [Parcubacteria group bacterium GW2011_GWC1_45_9]|nr:MAG: 50S ribosomal protein L25 [Parcubacteria group bacterium GW2011_GWB1_45_10]KKU16917.1 MAG: 50S ribosomal protein L25 [Parcubacteria group bacterium GW2011_GWC1_45_9]HCI05189.1 50S ribosomal protein L25 [Patescibacteria group bacterium]